MSNSGTKTVGKIFTGSNCLGGVAHRVVQWLLSEGHDAVHLRDEGLQRLPNGAIFEKATAERRAILTFDLDFGEVLALSGKTLEEGAVIVVEESRHRTRRLPF
ncbi:MAG: DUF5615 family PIN-like protein [Nitrospirae bacterium]|nr:DUF5615 family PIN-like protein [Nitrospirota bacterium]